MEVTALIRIKHGQFYSIMRKLGLSQNALAKELGINQTILGRIMNLRVRPSEELMDRLQIYFAGRGYYIDVLEWWPDSFRGVKISRGEITRNIEPAMLEYCNNTDAFMVEDQTSPEDNFMAKDNSRIARQVLATLTPREEKVMRLHFGLDEEEHNKAEIAREFNISPSRIAQIEAKILRKLRHPVRSKRLRNFIDDGFLSVKS